MSIGGNTCALLQVKGTGAKNSIGAFESEWLSSIPLIGWLDLSAGDSKHSTFNAKIQEGLFIKQTKRYKYTVNHTKKVYYSLEETVVLYQDHTRNDYSDPLPIMMGYGRVTEPGEWLGDIIGVSDQRPEGYLLLKELFVDW